MHEVRYVAVAVVAMGSSRRNPKRRKQVVISALMHVAWGNAAAVVVINFARLVHRGVGGYPRVMAQHVRVVVGATSYYYGTIHKLLYCSCCPACCVVWCVIKWCVIP